MQKSFEIAEQNYNECVKVIDLSLIHISLAGSLMISAKVLCSNHPEEATLPLRCLATATPLWTCQMWIRDRARTGNLKQFAEAVNYLTENKLLTLEYSQERLSSVNEELEALSDSIKKKSARITELQELIREGENYQRLKPVHTELNNIKFKKQRCV